MIREFQQTLESQLKVFDPRDVTDMAHFKSLRFDGRQGCRRYIVEHPFPDVMSMMLHKIAVAFLLDGKQYTRSELEKY